MGLLGSDALECHWADGTNACSEEGQEDMTDLFSDLFILELANNHLGDVSRGLRIIEEFARIVRFNNVRAAIKLQFRNVARFIHKDFRDRQDIRYIKKTIDTQLSEAAYSQLVAAVRTANCVTCATPFDEASVDLCTRLGIEIIKLASSDINDWLLIEAIAKTRKPVIASTGGSSLKDCDDLVRFFERRGIPLALNHCVSIYPSEDSDLELNQIDFLRGRYPNHAIGFSTHEYHDWERSMLMSYAKGARTWERHIDLGVPMAGENIAPMSPYCSAPASIDEWFKSYHKAKEMCGGPGTAKRTPPAKEIAYLDSLVRGVYALRDLPAGYVLRHESMFDDIYLAIPLQQGQLSCRELMNGETLLVDIAKDAPLKIDSIDTPYAASPSLKAAICKRGI